MMYLLIHEKHHVFHNENHQFTAYCFFLKFKIDDVFKIFFSVFRWFAIHDVYDVMLFTKKSISFRSRSSWIHHVLHMILYSRDWGRNELHHVFYMFWNNFTHKKDNVIQNSQNKFGCFFKKQNMMFYVLPMR